MRADRLVHLILLLQRHRRMTIPELAVRLEVSSRTISRDLLALSTAGVPVSTDRGANGGVRLDQAWRTDLSGLQSDEIRALLLGRGPGALRDLGWHRAGSAALTKWLGQMRPDQQAVAHAVGERFLVDERPWFSHTAPQPPHPDLITAVQQCLRVDVLYDAAPGTGAARTVSPLGLVCKVGTWYLVALRDDRLRVYRVGAMRSIHVGAQSFDRPAGFSLQAFWSGWTREFESSRPRYDVVLEVQEDAYPEFARATPWLTVDGVLTREEHSPSGWIPVRLTFGSADTACRHVMGFADCVRVERPPELAAMVRTRLASAIASLPDPSAIR